MSLPVNYKFKVAPTIATAIVLPILVSLGMWQLDRAKIKQHQLDVYKERSLQVATNLDSTISLENNDLRFKKLKISGHYLEGQNFLIDNRVYKQQVGFYVLSPFLVENTNKIVLVNRGWIKGNRYRTDLPTINTPKEKLTLNGVAYVPTKNFFAVDNVKIDVKKYPAVIQQIDFPAIKDAINSEVYSFVLRLDPGDKTGYVRDWKVVTSSPEKSQSYAAQWFTMALVVVLIYLSTSFKIRKEK